MGFIHLVLKSYRRILFFYWASDASRYAPFSRKLLVDLRFDQVQQFFSQTVKRFLKNRPLP